MSLLSLDNAGGAAGDLALTEEAAEGLAVVEEGVEEGAIRGLAEDSLGADLLLGVAGVCRRNRSF